MRIVTYYINIILGRETQSVRWNFTFEKLTEDTNIKTCTTWPEDFYSNINIEKSYTRGKSCSCNKYGRVSNDTIIAHSNPLKLKQFIIQELFGVEKD